MSVSTHVLDVAAGRPAEGIAVRLEHQDGQRWDVRDTRTTDADGRVSAFAGVGRAGVYRLTFDLERSHPGSFFPVATITFRVDDPEGHLHVPLLLSPFGYTTYRGS
jgi:5-hydroxyisourate hydrolase